MKYFKSQGNFEYLLLILSILFLVIATSLISFNNTKFVAKNIQIGEITNFLHNEVPQEQVKEKIIVTVTPTPNPQTVCVTQATCWYTGNPNANSFAWSSSLFCNGAPAQGSYVSCTPAGCSCTGNCAGLQNLVTGVVSGTGTDFSVSVTMNNGTVGGNFQGTATCSYPTTVTNNSCGSLNFTINPYCSPSTKQYTQIHFTTNADAGYTNYLINVYDSGTGQLLDSDQSTSFTSYSHDSKIFGTPVNLPSSIFFEVTTCNSACGQCISDTRDVSSRTCGGLQFAPAPTLNVVCRGKSSDLQVCFVGPDAGTSFDVLDFAGSITITPVGGSPLGTYTVFPKPGSGGWCAIVPKSAGLVEGVNYSFNGSGIDTANNISYTAPTIYQTYDSTFCPLLNVCSKSMPVNGFTKASDVNDCYICNYNKSSFIFEDNNYTRVTQYDGGKAFASGCDNYTNSSCETTLYNSTNNHRIILDSGYLNGLAYGYNFPFIEYGATFNNTYDRDVGNYINLNYSPATGTAQNVSNFYINYLTQRPTPNTLINNYWSRSNQPQSADKLFFFNGCTRGSQALGSDPCLCLKGNSCRANIDPGIRFNYCPPAGTHVPGEGACNASWGVAFSWNTSGRNTRNNTKPIVLLELPASLSSVSATSGTGSCQGVSYAAGIASDAAWCLDGAVIIAYDYWTNPGNTNFSFYYVSASGTGTPSYLGSVLSGGSYLTSTSGWQSVYVKGGFFYCNLPGGGGGTPAVSSGLSLSINGTKILPTAGSGSLNYSVTPNNNCGPSGVAPSGIIKLTTNGFAITVFPGTDHLYQIDTATPPGNNLIAANGNVSFSPSSGATLNDVGFSGIKYGWTMAYHNPTGAFNGLDDSRAYLDDLMVTQYGTGNGALTNNGITTPKFTRALWTFDDTSIDSTNGVVYANFVNETLDLGTPGFYKFVPPTTAGGYNPITATNNSVFHGFIRGLNGGLGGSWDPSTEKGDSVCAAILSLPTPNSFNIDITNPSPPYTYPWMDYVGVTDLQNLYCLSGNPSYQTNSLIIQPMRQYVGVVDSNPAYFNLTYASNVTGTPTSYTTTNYQVTATHTLRSLAATTTPFMSFYDLTNRFSYSLGNAGVISLKFNDPSGVSTDLYNDYKIIFDTNYTGKGDYSSDETYDQYAYHFEKSPTNSLGPTTEQEVDLKGGVLNLVSFYAFNGVPGGAPKLHVVRTSCKFTTSNTGIWTWENDSSTNPLSSNWVFGANPAASCSGCPSGNTPNIPATTPNGGYISSNDPSITFGSVSFAQEGTWNKISDGTDFSKITPLRGYGITPDADCSIVVSGRILSEWTDRPLTAGWNLVGSPSILASLQGMNCKITGAPKTSDTISCNVYPSGGTSCNSNAREPGNNLDWNDCKNLEPGKTCFVNIGSDCNFHFNDLTNTNYNNPDTLFTPKSYTINFTNYSTTRWNSFSIPYWNLNVHGTEAYSSSQYSPLGHPSAFKYFSADTMLYGQPYAKFTTTCTNLTIFSYNGQWIRYYSTGTNGWTLYPSSINTPVELKPGYSYVANTSFINCSITFTGSLNSEFFSNSLSASVMGTISAPTFTDSSPTTSCPGSVIQMSYDSASDTWGTTPATSTQIGGGYFANSSSDCNYYNTYSSDYAVSIWVDGNYKGKYPVHANSSTSWLKYGSLSAGTDTLDSEFRFSDGYRMCAGPINYTAPSVRVGYTINVGATGKLVSIPTYDIDSKGNPVISDITAQNCLILKPGSTSSGADVTTPNFASNYYSTSAASSNDVSGAGFYSRDSSGNAPFYFNDDYCRGKTFGSSLNGGFCSYINEYASYGGGNMPLGGPSQTLVTEVNYRPKDPGSSGNTPGNQPTNDRTIKTLTNQPFGDLIDGGAAWLVAGPYGLTDWGLKRVCNPQTTFCAYFCGDGVSSCRSFATRPDFNAKSATGRGGDWYPKGNAKSYSKNWFVVSSASEMKAVQGYYAIPYNKSAGDCNITGTGTFPSSDFDGPSFDTTKSVLVSPGIFPVITSSIWLPSGCTLTSAVDSSGASVTRLLPGNSYRLSFSGTCSGTIRMPNRNFVSGSVDTTSP